MINMSNNQKPDTESNTKILELAAEQWVNLLFAQVSYREPDRSLIEANKKENNHGKRSN